MTTLGVFELLIPVWLMIVLGALSFLAFLFKSPKLGWTFVVVAIVLAIVFWCDGWFEMIWIMRNGAGSGGWG